jgi:galactitol-specific phosphotransferase system IIB component
MGRRKESVFEKKFQRVVSMCKDFGLSVSLDKCVITKISQKRVGVEMTTCNDHEVKELESFKNLGSKVATNANVIEEITNQLALWCQNPKVHHCIQKSLPPVPILSQLNPHNPPPPS